MERSHGEEKCGSNYNRLRHRFTVDLIGSFVLWFMWVRFAWIILG